MTTHGIGVTGHQTRPGIDWKWVAGRIRDQLTDRAPVGRAFSSLAAGSDQVFAEQALALGIPVTAIIPLPDYERCFKEKLDDYRSLLARCDQIVLDGAETDQEAFLEAGRQVVDNADVLLAIWDGKMAQGLGGTADVVEYALGRGREVIHINPVELTVRDINPAE
ncbi:hypothetical protein Geu3261_0251_010 [Komagataeibacter europaeus NBRC 3261]|uniref:DNA recombination-mediator protein A n=1 Tax=Komagataeibacter europaeus NBRC 3261 TaxID=1234669 RepID=A0A0D6Q2V0_KOMEU|nr:hypothetical protein [Komagataeibacter europaeus]GAN97759.1 hypothetical protein Geu3261_0251_010 [Komagataeibacter europaeus NBRC 3261]